MLSCTAELREAAELNDQYLFVPHFYIKVVVLPIVDIWNIHWSKFKYVWFLCSGKKSNIAVAVMSLIWQYVRLPVSDGAASQVSILSRSILVTVPNLSLLS